MNLTSLRRCAPAALAALIAAAPLTAPALAAGKQVTIVISPKTEKGERLLRKGLKVISTVQEKRNAAKVIQKGSGNQASVSQTGNGNNAAVIQRGSGHFADVTQSGNGNALGLIQLGRKTTASPVQNGDGKASLIIQRGW